MSPTPEQVEARLHELWIATPGTRLRREDRKKSVELTALLGEVERALPRRGASLLVDAAAGKAYVGVLAAELVLRATGRDGTIVVIERDEHVAALSREAAARLDPGGPPIDVRVGDVSDPACWPAAPDVVVALHACGPAADAVLDAAVAVRARRLLLVPCCTGARVPAEGLARRRAEALGIPRQAPVRRAFVESIVAAERTLRLEAAGYAVEVLAFVPPTVTPYNTLWRARRLGDDGRAARARAALAHLRDA